MGLGGLRIVQHGGYAFGQSLCLTSSLLDRKPDALQDLVFCCNMTRKLQLYQLLFKLQRRYNAALKCIPFAHLLSSHNPIDQTLSLPRLSNNPIFNRTLPITDPAILNPHNHHLHLLILNIAPPSTVSRP